MAIYEDLDVFAGKTIKPFKADDATLSAEYAIRVSVDYEDAEDGVTLLSEVEKLINAPFAKELTHLIIGEWEECYEDTPEDAIAKLSQSADALPALQYVFFGEMTSEACEMSWIQQVDYKDFLANFPNLVHFQVRGGTGLLISNLEHDNLETLIIETGGMEKELVAQVAESSLPSLKHLELWLGEENYGWTGSIEQLESITQKYAPQLNYLGLKNSEESDEIAQMLQKNQDSWSKLSELDLSMGTLGDVGAEALLSCAALDQLQKLNLAHHYMSDETMVRFSSYKTLDVNISEQEETDEYDGEEYRYISVGE
ncbi:STM4015 family protein [Pleionea sp. CnH1-48]|uniref:STM4015 family protein n=1 Tax=Pleionea sp. CnH1-48 TaxID=2954494 RepID=UPI0020973242|nr:STM4015 family protein [Pleionea sp. CnH1-48]MCO7225098.1 STM4015 family protein [Pleionea sp. CnH1-48]